MPSGAQASASRVFATESPPGTGRGRAPQKPLPSTSNILPDLASGCCRGQAGHRGFWLSARGEARRTVTLRGRAGRGGRRRPGRPGGFKFRRRRRLGVNGCPLALALRYYWKLKRRQRRLSLPLCTEWQCRSGRLRTESRRDTVHSVRNGPGSRSRRHGDQCQPEWYSIHGYIGRHRRITAIWPGQAPQLHSVRPDSDCAAPGGGHSRWYCACQCQ
jgi:hypothetical protein